MSTTPISTAADASGYAAAAVAYRTDGELLEAWAVDREHDALSALVHRYAALVISVCRRQCRDRHDADDAFQATFLALARHAGSVRRADRLGGWLHRVAYRTACRARARNRQAPGSLQDDPPDPRQPLDQVARRHQLRVLDEELAALPERYQTVVVLHLIEGHTLAQVARQTGATTGTVRGRLQRGKQQLRNRLRRRGIVPGAAAATLALWPTEGALAAAAAERFLVEVQPPASSGGDPPPDTSSLDSLLQNGTHSMTLYSIGGGSVAAAILLALVLGDGGQPDGNGGAAERPTISLIGGGVPPHLAQVGGGQSGAAQPKFEDPFGQPASAPRAAAPDPSGAAAPVQTVEEAADEIFGTAADRAAAARSANPFGGSSRSSREATQSPLATQITKALDQPIRIDLPTTSVDELPDRLTQQLGIPVLLDPRGVAMAEADGKQVQMRSDGLPLRTSLRKLLRPLGLKAVVEDEGLTITADTAELARRGIGTDQWINVDAAAAERIEAALAKTASLQVIEETLGNVVRILSEASEIPIRVDERALEEIGLTRDTPVTLQAEDVSLRAFLQLMLNELGLTYTIRGETLVLTTPEEADSSLLVRVYWLDATGASQFDSLTETLRYSVEPDHWEEAGGPGSISPLLLHDRAALTVAATLPVHEQVERFMEVLRESHLGPDPPFDRQRWEQMKQKQMEMQMQIQPGMGGGMGGMGGMGGGGMH